MSLCVESSAYDTMFMLAGVGGVSCMLMLKSVGDSVGEISCVR